ncbi:hypothetical protein SAMN04487939_12250 [Lysobacter sp. yr284]|uniref:hypothetical protein n=1 Tax=Lysobacter sp. yr284 TaxID=1761791 RepID=UPI000895712C|nr:hypothetical protein [Lysobacter sp. yr284]SDZ20330.1 hypothetical protein SAMN04487939_12250 [Lysobacter sp. yr284]
MDSEDVLKILVARFEERFGRLPTVSSPEELIENFRRAAERNESDTGDVSQYIRILIERGYIPCRGADGEICFVFLNDGLTQNGDDA